MIHLIVMRPDLLICTWINRLHYWSSPVHKGARYQYIWLWGQIFFFALSLNYDSYYLPLTCIVVGLYGGSNKGKGTTHTSQWGYMQMAALLIAITNLLAIFLTSKHLASELLTMRKSKEIKKAILQWKERSGVEWSEWNSVFRKEKL